MRFRPKYGGLTYTLQVRIEAFNLILCLGFAQVRIVYSHNILEFGVDNEGHDKSGKVLIREGDCSPLSVT